MDLVSNAAVFSLFHLQSITSDPETQDDESNPLTKRKSIDTDETRESYISSLQQQIKLLELEVAYLKNHHEQYHSRKSSSAQKGPSQLESKPSSNPVEHVEANNSSNVVKELTCKLDASAKEKKRLQDRISTLESHNEDEKRRCIQEICDLTGQTEMLKNDNEILEGRLRGIQEETNKLKIDSKDKKQSLEEAKESLTSKDEELKNIQNELNSLRINFSTRDTQFHELEDKFLQSSVHVIEEAMRSLKNENGKLSRELKIKELEEDSRVQLRAKQEEQVSSLVAENADLSSKLAELKSKLESEVRLRDTRDSKGILDSQEIVVLREKERQLRERVSVLGDQLDREKERFKSVSEKLSKESQDNTSLELRISTLNHRISELEGSLTFANESTNKIRKQSLLDQDKISTLQNELSESRDECKAIYKQLAECEYHIKEVECRCEALSNTQSRKWLEFSKMADSMKELSHSMLVQSTNNTRRSNSAAEFGHESRNE